MNIHLKKNLYVSSFLGLAVLLAACSDKNETPLPEAKTGIESCIRNVHIYRDGDMWAGTIQISDGKISALGAPDGCKAYAGTGTKILDLGGAWIYPGFVDTHAHLLGIGLREMTLNLEGTKSLKEVVTKLAEEVEKTPKGETVYGRGWIETHWPEHRFPNRHDLDAVSPDNPVILQRADGHAVVVNSAALKAAGITRETKPPFGGDILKDENGAPTGMIIDNAMSLIEGLKPKLTPERRRAAYIKASEVYARYGWTGLHSMSAIAADVPLIEELSDTGKLKIRVYNAVDLEGADALLDEIAKNGPRVNRNGRVVTRAIKLYMDGALGSRGAALLAPYSDDPGNSGLLV
ncbi:MAG TPA: amidohydrolase, partial [Hellea balneolensis]|nr:amidohydrolase [Hellea balneolensis]